MGTKWLIALLVVLATLHAAVSKPTSIEAPAEDKLPKRAKHADPEAVSMAEEFITSLLEKKDANFYATVGNANDYLDKLIVKLQDFLKINGYDPLDMENVVDEIKEIYMKGLSSVKRTGPATLTHQNSALTVDANLGFDYLKGNVKFEKQLWWVFWISGTLKINVRDIAMRAKLHVSLLNGVKPKLEEFEVTNWGTLESELDGDNWIAHIVELASWVVPSIVSSFLKKNLPDIIKQAVGAILDNVDISFPFP